METPRKFLTAFIIVINLRGVSTNKTIIYFIAMQTYKELKKGLVVPVIIYDGGWHRSSHRREFFLPIKYQLKK